MPKRTRKGAIGMDNAAQEFARKVVNELQKIRNILGQWNVTGHPNGPREEHKEAVANQDRAAKENSKANDGTAFVAPNHPAPAKPKNIYRKSYRCARRWKPFLEIAALVAGIGYAIVTYYQWRDLRDNFKVEQRAWIGVMGVGIEGLVSGTVTARFPLTITNTGKTPARFVEFRSNLGYVRHPNGKPEEMIGIGGGESEKIVGDFDPARKPKNTNRAGTIQPGAQNQILHTAIFSSGIGVTPDEIMTGNKTVFLQGIIWYTDIFGGEHWTRYCFQFWYFQPTGFIPCRDDPRKNDAN